MASAFASKGAISYFGYTKVVNSNFAQSAANQLFQGIVTEKMNAGDAFAAVTPKTDPVGPNATFVLSGETDLVYSGRFRNGSFENGFEAWTREGDGRIISQLGAFRPPDGDWMSIISTGLGFTTSSGSIEQSFCLPESATAIEFKWNYSSEEFIEYCGAQFPFDDPFRVEIVHDAGTSLLFERMVDSLCGQVQATPLFFDQSGPGCVPDEDVGFGTGGNDCTVWSTNWITTSIGIDALASSNAGKGVKLRFRVFDTGDSFFDTAVLVDDVRVVVP